MEKEKPIGINAENLLGHEIMGLGVEVMKSTDKGKEGATGRVIDETRNTITIETGGKEKVIPKKEVWLRFRLPGGNADVNGPDLVARPEDRTKIWWRKRHG